MKIRIVRLFSAFKRPYQQAGFSLLEVIVALYILLVGIVGVMSLIVGATQAGAVSASRLLAANLAQEGIEVVKNIRDLNYDGNGWTNWHANLVAGNYLVQYNDTSLRPYANTILLYDAAAGLYSYSGGSVGKFNFRRTINLSNIVNGVSVKVISTVSWTENGRNHSLAVEDDLWNWR